MKTRFEPRLPRMSWKNIEFHTLDLNSGTLCHEQIFRHWTIKARCLKLILVPFRTTKACHSCRFGRFVPSTGVFTWAASWGFNGFKGTQEWEIFWLRFWILYYFIVSYVKILRFIKKNFLIGPVLEEVRFFLVVLGLREMKTIFELGQKNIFLFFYLWTLYMS